MDTTTVFSFIGKAIVLLGGLSLVIYEIFKHLTVKWLETRFDERLQSLKHEHDKEIEQLRFKISTLLDRSIKLHQREYELLPEAWAKLTEAFWATDYLIFPLRQHPDLAKMKKEELDDFLAASNLREFQKEELRNAKNVNDYYFEIASRSEFAEAMQKARTLRAFFVKNKIFMPKSIVSRLETIHKLMWDAIMEHKYEREYRRQELLDKTMHRRVKQDEFNQKGEGLIQELEQLIHQRFWYQCEESSPTTNHKP